MTSTDPAAVDHGVVIGNEPYLEGDSAELVDLAVAAETAGWDGVFLGDHLCPDAYTEELQAAFDPWTTLAAIASQTEELVLGTWVTPVPRRQPWQLARDLATLDRLSDGRVMLGAGLGAEPDYATFGTPWEPPVLGDRYDEALEVISGLWTGEPFSFDGDHFTVEDAVLRPTPVQAPRIPILTGCWWPNRKPFHRGAAWDGIMPNWESLFGRGDHAGEPEVELRAMLEYYHEVADIPGEIVVPIDPVDGSPTYVETALELDVTWFLTTHYPEPDGFDLGERIEAGPPNAA